MIETERLVLRPHALDDVEASYALGSDPEVMRLITGVPISREEAWHRLLRFAGHWSLLGYGMFAVFEKGGGFVGETGLAQFCRGLGEAFDPFPEAAWVFARAAHGRGYASEAAAAVHDWFAQHRRPVRTVCMINPENAASLRVAQKLGYRPLGSSIYRERAVSLFERPSAAGDDASSP